MGLNVGLKMKEISDLKAKNIKPGDNPVPHGKVTGLRLESGTTKGHGKWTMRFVSPLSGKRRDMGLGGYPEVSIADARVKAEDARRLIANGKDPIREKQAEKVAQNADAAILTFEKAAEKVHTQQKPGWKNSKHADQWINTLRVYVFPEIGKRKVDDLTPEDFANALRPIWLTKPETASRVKQRCHKVMKSCRAQGLVKANPVEVVDHLLPLQPGKRERVRHQPSMPWQGVPAFVRDVLRTSPSNVTRNLLEFVILTAARSGEAREATWNEVDLKANIWTVPASRMKSKVVHRVPLSARAVEILQAQKMLHPDNELVFPAPRRGVLSDMVLTGFLRDQKAPSSDTGRVATAHGFRSSFRDWASESGYARDLAERALAHTIQNQAEAAYHRTDLLEQRRGMMEDWAQHIGGKQTTGKILPMRRSS